MKPEQGGGLVPLTVGENQTPAGDHTFTLCTHIYKLKLYKTTLTEVEHMDLIGPSSPISLVSVPDER